MCVTKSIAIQSHDPLDLEMLQSFAEESGVTLKIEDAEILILGIEGAVAEATKEFLRFAADEKSAKLGRNAGQPCDAAFLAISDALSKLKGDCNPEEIWTTSTTADSLSLVSNEASSDCGSVKTNDSQSQGIAFEHFTMTNSAMPTHGQPISTYNAAAQQ